MKNLFEEKLRIQSIIESSNSEFLMEAIPTGLLDDAWRLLKTGVTNLGSLSDDFLAKIGVSSSDETVQALERNVLRDSEERIIGGGSDNLWKALARKMNFESFMEEAFRKNLLGDVSQGHRTIIDDLIRQQRDAGGDLPQDAIETALEDYVEFLNNQTLFRNNDDLFNIARNAFDKEIDDVIVRTGGDLPEVTLSNKSLRDLLNDIFKKDIRDIVTLNDDEIKLLQLKGFSNWFKKNFTAYFLESTKILEDIQKLIKSLQANPQMILNEKKQIYEAIDSQLGLLAKSKKGLDLELQDWVNRNLNTRVPAEKDILEKFKESKDKLNFSKDFWERFGLKQAWDSYSSLTKRVYNNLPKLAPGKGGNVQAATDILVGGSEKSLDNWRKVTSAIYGSRRTLAEYKKLAKDIGVPAALISYGTEAVLLRGMELSIVLGTLAFVKRLIGSGMSNQSTFWQGWIEADEDASDIEKTLNTFVNLLDPMVKWFKLTGFPGLGDEIYNTLQWIGSREKGWAEEDMEELGRRERRNSNESNSLVNQARQNSNSSEMTENDVKNKIDKQFKDYNQKFYNENKSVIDAIKNSVKKESAGNYTFNYENKVYDITFENDLVKYNVPELQGDKKNIVYFLTGDIQGIQEIKKMKGLATLLVKEQGVGIETPQQTPADIIKKYQDTFVFKDEEGNEMKVNVADAKILSLWDDVKKMKDKNGEFFQEDDAFVRAVIMYFIDTDKPIYSVSYRPTSDIDVALDENKKVVGLAILLEQSYEKTIYVDRIPGTGNFKLKGTPGRKYQGSIELDAAEVTAKMPEKLTQVDSKKPEDSLKVDLKAKQLEKRALAIENSQGNLSERLEELIVLATTPDKYGYPTLGPCKSIFRFYYQMSVKKTKSNLVSDELLDKAVQAMSDCQDRYKNITPKIVEYLSNTIPDGSEYNEFRFKINFAKNDRPIKTWRGGMMNKPQ